MNQSISDVVGKFLSNAIGHKVTTVIGVVVGLCGFIVVSSMRPDATSALSPQVVQILGYVGSVGAVLFGAAAKNPDFLKDEVKDLITGGK